jgi:hypothetical protein
VHEENRCGNPRTAGESTEYFRQMFEEDQKLSVRNASDSLKATITTDHRILCSTLKKKPYHIQMLHDLHEEDYPRQAAMCTEPVDKIQNDSLMGRILFDVEAISHVCGKIYRNNSRIWAKEKQIMERRVKICIILLRVVIITVT